MSTFTKDPDARLDFAVDWGPFLAAGETITTPVWLAPTPVTVPPLVLTDAGLDGNKHVAWITGGLANRAYRVTSRITTSDTRINDQSFTIVITET